MIYQSRVQTPVDVEEAPARRNHRRAARLALVEPSLPALLKDPRDPGAIRDIILRARRSVRQARRMADEALEALRNDEPPPAERLNQDFLVSVVERNGNVAAAIRDVWPDEKTRPRSSVYRWMDDNDKGLIYALRHGRQGLDHFMEVGIYEPLHRNELYLLDETKIPIAARNKHGQRVDNLHLISVFDVFGRVIVNGQVTIGPSDELIASAVLARALAGGTWDGLDYGGCPQAFGLDNAFIFARSERFKAVMRRAGVPPKYARPYTAQDKAMLERWHRTLKDMGLSAVPGNNRGPKHWVYRLTGEIRPDGKPKKERVERAIHDPVDPAQLLTVEEVTEAIYAAIHDYNANHVHSVTKMTPLARYASDPTPLRRLGVAALWDFALPVGTPGKPTYTVERRGVWIEGERWTAKGKVQPQQQVSVRVLAGMNPRYLVGTPRGQFIAELTPSRLETEDERLARLDRNHTRGARISLITKISVQRTLARAAGEPGTAAYAGETTAKKMAAAAVPTLASLEAALNVPEGIDGAA